MKRSSANNNRQKLPEGHARQSSSPRVLRKSTLDLPPAASHLRQRESDSTNCVSQPHCRRKASNCSTQKTVHRAEMSPSSRSVSRNQRAAIDDRKKKRTAKLERPLRGGSQHLLHSLRNVRFLERNDRELLARGVIPRAEPVANARQLGMLECLVVLAGAVRRDMSEPLHQ